MKVGQKHYLFDNVTSHELWKDIPGPGPRIVIVLPKDSLYEHHI